HVLAKADNRPLAARRDERARRADQELAASRRRAGDVGDLGRAVAKALQDLLHGASTARARRAVLSANENVALRVPCSTISAILSISSVDAATSLQSRRRESSNGASPQGRW